MSRHKLVRVFTKNVLILFLICFSLSGFHSPVFAAHGCLTNEPDRDEDGVPDKDDPFPDDPSRGGLEEKYCGDSPLVMKMFFIPFSADIRGPVTKDSIESRKANAYWFCSKNEVADSILNILTQAMKETAAMSELAAGTMAPNHIRLKAATLHLGTEDEIYYADKFGLATQEGKAFNLSQEQMAKIEEIAKTIDCGAESKVHCDLAASLV